MIINKITKEVQTRSDKPNTNWLDENWYLVGDGTELAVKIQQLYPRLDFMLDENNNLIDVIEVPKTPQEIAEERRQEIYAELESLDKTINRATEDLYALTDIAPYTTIQTAITRKNELRAELASL